MLYINICTYTLTTATKCHTTPKELHKAINWKNLVSTRPQWVRMSFFTTQQLNNDHNVNIHFTAW